MPIRLPFPYGDSPDPDATLPAGTHPDMSRTRPAPPANDYEQSPYPLPAPSSPYQHQPASAPIDVDPNAPPEARYPVRAAPPPPPSNGGNGGGNGNGNDGNGQWRNWGIVGAIIVVLIVIVGVLVIHPSGTTSLAQTATPTATITAISTATTTPTALPTATTIPASCALPAAPTSLKVPSASTPFHFTFAAGMEAWYTPALEQETSTSNTLPIDLCLPNNSFDQLEQAITIDGTFWHKATSCSAVACWSMSSTTHGTPYALSITLDHTSQHDTGAVFTLTMTTIAVNPGGLAKTNDVYIIQPGATTADIGWASATSVNPLGSALIAVPAAGLTYDTLHITAIAHNCGHATAAYSPNELDVSTMSIICARTNDGHYAKLKISYTSDQITFVSGVVYPTEFW